MLLLASTLSSARPSTCRTAGRSGLPASLGLTLTIGRPPRDHSQVPGAATPGIGDPRTLAAGSPYRPAMTQPARGNVLMGRENGQGPPSPRRTPKASYTKTLGPALPLTRALTSARPSTLCTAGGSDLPSSWGLTLTLGWSQRGPSQGAWHCHAGGWGTRATTPDAPCHPTATQATRRAATGHSGLENMQSLPSHPRTSKAPHAKMPGPTLPLASALTLACHSVIRTAGGWGLPASFRLTLTLGRLTRGPSQGAWCCHAGDWGPPSTSTELTLPPRCDPAH